MTLTVGIYLFDEVEVLDFAGPFEVFSTAARVKSRLDSQAVEAFKVFTIADEQRTVAARGNLLVQPHYALTDHPPLDMLIIPGGVVTAELERKPVIDWIATVAQTTEVTASVCTGAFLLAKAGLLHNQPAITHWEDIDDLRTMFPDIDIKDGVRWVDTGPIVTSAGISAGIDMSLHLVARLEGEALAAKTARQMEFDWEHSPAKNVWL